MNLISYNTFIFTDDLIKHHGVDGLKILDECIQKPFQYLQHYHRGKTALEKFQYIHGTNTEKDQKNVIQTLYRYVPLLSLSTKNTRGT